MDISALLQRSIGKTSLGDVLSALVTLIICLCVIKLLMKLLSRLFSHTKLEHRVQRYFLSGIRLILYILTGIIVASSLGIDMTSLVALLSVGSLGITLAAEDILANVAGGLVILSSHPFSLGDLIEVGGTIGTVEEIKLNHTRLLTADGHLVMLPNKSLAASQMINFTAHGKRRIVQKVSASYDATTETVRTACLEAVSQAPNILKDPAPIVYLTDYGDSAITYTVYCWTKPEYYWESSWILNEELRESFSKYKIEMTYPHLNIHVVDS